MLATPSLDTESLPDIGKSANRHIRGSPFRQEQNSPICSPSCSQKPPSSLWPWLISTEAKFPHYLLCCSAVFNFLSMKYCSLPVPHNHIWNPQRYDRHHCYCLQRGDKNSLMGKNGERSRCPAVGKAASGRKNLWISNALRTNALHAYLDTEWQKESYSQGSTGDTFAITGPASPCFIITVGAYDEIWAILRVGAFD